jgi:hypothetical protein
MLNFTINRPFKEVIMPEKKEKKVSRVGVPRVGEAYQEMLESKEFEEEIAKRERRRGEKAHSHEEHERAKVYEKNLPPVEERISEERPPFKKR